MVAALPANDDRARCLYMPESTRSFTMAFPAASAITALISSSGSRSLFRTAVDARTDGDDVNLVTTSASGELPNHPETKAAVEQGSPETNATLNPRKEP